jgi:hypothetical protein
MAYASCSYPVLVESAPFHHICFKAVVDLWHEFECECLQKWMSAILRCPKDQSTSARYLQNSCSWNAMRKQIVQLRPDLEDSRWCAFFHNLFRNDLDKCFPIGRRYGCLLAHAVAKAMLANIQVE